MQSLRRQELQFPDHKTHKVLGTTPLRENKPSPLSLNDGHLAFSIFQKRGGHRHLREITMYIYIYKKLLSSGHLFVDESQFWAVLISIKGRFSSLVKHRDFPGAFWFIRLSMRNWIFFCVCARFTRHAADCRKLSKKRVVFFLEKVYMQRIKRYRNRKCNFIILQNQVTIFQLRGFF